MMENCNARDTLYTENLDLYRSSIKLRIASTAIDTNLYHFSIKFRSEGGLFAYLAYVILTTYQPIEMHHYKNLWVIVFFLWALCDFFS